MKCESCGMPIESGHYCKHCTDESGNLQTLEERLKRLTLFMQSRDPSLSDEQAKEQAKKYMRQMPAWRDKL